MAKRQGRKSAAQTPAPPKERIFGSKKNPKGSASSEKTASKIQLSDQIIKTLEKKLKEFKEKYPSKKNVTLADLKAVFRRGAGAYSKSHRPFITGGVPNSRNAWAYARVNKFLKKAAGQKVKAAYVQDDDLLKREDGGEIFAKGGLIAPNGKKSNLTPEQYKLVRTPQFKEWFGDWENDPENASKVVDENGEPLVVYHATQYAFTIPKVSKIDIGIHFGTKNQAISRMKQLKIKEFNLLPSFIIIKNPLRALDKKSWFGTTLAQILSVNKIESFKKMNDELNELKNKYKYNEEGKIVPNWSIKAFDEWNEINKNRLYNSKYDGIFYTNKYEDKNSLDDSYIVFNPNQVKLADGSNTTFDSDSDDIRYAQGGGLVTKKNDVNVPLYHGTIKEKWANSEYETNLYVTAKFEVAKNYALEYESGTPIVIKIDPNQLKTFIWDVDCDYDDDVCKEVGLVTWQDSFNKKGTFVILGKFNINDFEVIEIENQYSKGGLIAPNGKKSNLTPEQYKLVRTPQFKAWFGDWENDPENASKVVDENGEPLVVYHGSDYVFNVFKTNKQIYFATNKEYASEISESGRVKSFFLNIRNLLDATKFYIDDYSHREYKTFLKKNGIDVRITRIDNENVSKFWYLISNSNVWKSIKEKYDGFSMYENMFATKGKIEEEDFDDPFTKVYVCFEANQIKLADGTNKKFNTSNPDIRYAEGGEIEFEYLREAEDEEVENFFDCNWQEISRWSEGEGRGTTPHAIYTNGSQYLLEREDYGFDGYNSPQYFFVSINDSFAKGGEIDPKVLRERWAKKKDALENLANNIQRLRTNLYKDLKGSDDKEKLTALVIITMNETGERVGNDESADNGHLGITGLKKKNVSVNGSKIKFKYTGKSGVEHEKEINNHALASAYKEAIKNSPSEYVFETSDGFRIKNDRVNRYLNRFDVSAKDLRGYSANKWIITRLKSVKDREILGDAKKRKTKFNEIVKDVAEKVGHGRATLKKHYLLPSLEREFINHGKIVDLSNIKRTYEDGGEVNSLRSAKQQFATDLQTDKDFQEAKKRAIYDERGRTFGTPNVLINDPYVRKARYKHFKIDDSDINDDDIYLIDVNENINYAKGGDVPTIEVEKLNKDRLFFDYENKGHLILQRLPYSSFNINDYADKQGLVNELKKYGIDSGEKVWSIEIVKVSPRYRGQGVASTLLSAAIKWAKENKYEKLVLIVQAQFGGALSNEQLYELYSKFKFKPLKKAYGVNWMARKLDKGGILKRLAPGFYEGTYKGVKFTITQQEENAYGGKPMWYFQIENGSVDDLFFTKAQTLEAVKYFIDNSSKYSKGGKTKDMIALPDTYAHFNRLKEILRNQGYDLTKKGMARGGDTHDEINTGFDALANLETEPLNELADVPNDGLGIYDKGGKTQYSDGVSKLVNKESIEHLIPTFDEDDINWFKLIHSKDLINQLLENIGIPIKVKFELGEGANGTAWMTENDTVLKLTKNGAEAYSSYIIFKNQENFTSQAEIYNIFIINDYSKVDVQRIYFIEKQFLNPFQDSKASSISHIYNDIEATATATKYSNNDRLEMLENIIRDENLSEQESIYARQVFALAKDVDKEARAYGINLRDNHSGNVGFDNNGKLLCYDCAYLGNKKLNKGGNLKNENMENLKVGGEISQEEKKEIYAKWKKLVNMSKSELQKFYDSEEGKQAGLTPEEAKEAGIDSGRESARWIMKMKDTKVADWTPTMWMWAKKQISFVSRMSGNKGKLVDENGKKTRKYLSLLIWGNDPNKKAGGGDINEPCHVCSMNDAQYQNLPALGEMADGKRFVYRESVFAKGGDTMSHVGDRYLILECMGEGGITDTLNLKVIQSSSPALLVGSVINRPIRNIINKGREMGTTFGQNIVGSYKKGGELNPDNKAVKNYFEHKSGSAGGLLVGKRHSEGGIKAINNSTGQPLEMEGGEVVITRDAVSDPSMVEYEGKKMTKREVLSEINQSGGGVAFADGGVVGEKTA